MVSPRWCGGAGTASLSSRIAPDVSPPARGGRRIALFSWIGKRNPQRSPSRPPHAYVRRSRILQAPPGSPEDSSAAASPWYSNVSSSPRSSMITRPPFSSFPKRSCSASGWRTVL